MRAKTYWNYNELLHERKKTVKDTVAFMEHLILWCLHDEYGFGHDRLQRVLNWLEKHAGEYMGKNGEVSLSDVNKMLHDECGINIY